MSKVMKAFLFNKLPLPLESLFPLRSVRRGISLFADLVPVDF